MKITSTSTGKDIKGRIYVIGRYPVAPTSKTTIDRLTDKQLARYNELLTNFPNLTFTSALEVILQG